MRPEKMCQLTVCTKRCFDKFLADSIKRMKNMPPEELEAMKRIQSLSWARGKAELARQERGMTTMFPKEKESFSHASFDLLVEDTFREIKQLVQVKGGEYSGDVDRLANFRRNAEDQGLQMEAVWRTYAGKHWDALTQYVKDLNTGKQRQRSESLGGRVDDLIVYLLLFKAMLRERQTEGEKK